MPSPVLIVDYDPQWPILYEKEKLRILGVVGHKILSIEHIGSTAVPGLGAKPIIDIMAGIRESDDAEECLPLLGEIGYTDITPQPENPDWYYCLGKRYQEETVYPYIHLHLVRSMSKHWENHLLFRDFLRTHPEEAQQYYELKKKLATRYRSDRNAYTEAKTSFIESIVAKARHHIISPA